MTLLTPGNVINSLNPYRGEGYPVYPRIHAQRYFAFAKFNEAFQSSMDLMIPSRQTETPDRPLIFVPEEVIYSINTLLTTPLTGTGNGNLLKVGDTVANTNNFTAATTQASSVQIQPGFASTTNVPGQTLTPPLGQASTVFPGLQMRAFVTSSVGNAASGGAKVDPTPTPNSSNAGNAAAFQKLYNRYGKDKPYLIVEVCTYRIHTDTFNPAQFTDLDFGKMDTILDLCFRGL